MLRPFKGEEVMRFSSLGNFSLLLAALVLMCSSAAAQYAPQVASPYPAPGTATTPSAMPPGMSAGAAAPAGRAPIQSATPNSVNTQFPQGGASPFAVAGANGRPMPTLNPYQTMQAQQQTRAFNGPVQYGQHTPAAAPEKPFADYEAAPVLSPYMQLFRRDNFTGIDNYNLYVKPALEAEAKRQQMQQQLNAIQQNQSQTQVQQQAQFNSNVGAATVGAAYGQMNTGMNANNPGASYGFSGSGPTVHVDPARAQEKTDKEKIDEEAEEDEEDAKQPAYFNPYTPTRRGVIRPHYEPAGK